MKYHCNTCDATMDLDPGYRCAVCNEVSDIVAYVEPSDVVELPIEVLTHVAGGAGNAAIDF